jgi:uncharacterized protein with FMN-binding domain
VRISTKSAIGAITLGVIGLSYNLGEQAVLVSHSFSAPPIAPPASTETPAQPGASAPASALPSQGTSAGTTTTKPNPAVPSPSATTAQTQAPVVNPPTATSKTIAGPVIQSGYGTVQVKVTKVGSTITDVTMLQANATDGRATAFPYLVQYAITANGSNFANLSGATYTTDAFKQSLDAALAKF